MLNLDSEEDGSIFIGCAGGVDTIGIFDLKFSPAGAKITPYRLSVTGLKGGHSGLEIHKGHANAIKLLARSLKELENNKISFTIAHINGGTKRNAIPCAAEATICIQEKQKDKARQILTEFEGKLHQEYGISDPEVKLILKKSGKKVNEVINAPLGAFDGASMAAINSELFLIHIYNGKIGGCFYETGDAFVHFNGAVWKPE